MGDRRAIVALGAALAAMAAGGRAWAAPPRVGLVIATRVNLTDGEADSLASRLGDALRQQLDVDVIAGVEARRRLPPGGIREDCVARPECVRDVAARLDGDEILFLFLARIGPRVQIDATWTDPSRGVTASRNALVLEENAETQDQVLAAAPRQLLPNAKVRVAEAKAVEAGREGGEAGHEASPAAPTFSRMDDAATEMPAPEVDLMERREGRRVTIPVVIAGAVTVAALGTGVGFAIAARQDYDSLEKDGCARAACPGVESRIDKMERRALVADVFFAGAGVAAATTLILYLASSDSSHVRVGAVGSGRGAVVSYGGSF